MKKAIVVLLIAAVAVGSIAAAKRPTLDQYALVYEDIQGGRVKSAAREIQKCLMQMNNNMPALCSAAEFEGAEYEILVGHTGRPESIEAAKGFLTPMDYSIRVTKDKVVIVGYTPFATAAAADKYIQLLKEDPKLYESKKYSYDYHFDTSYLNPICYDLSQFKPKWTALYDMPPAWMDDYYESLYAVSQKDGRQTVFAHRADFKYYPQSSLEGLASSILCGTDAIEVDFRLTKDNVPVMMHDEDLRKNTNCASKMGRNGLPNSYYIGDWTYEQLQQLNMTMNTGANTKFKIATCYEALLVARQGGAQITWDDKADETDRPVFAATTKTTFDDMFPLMNGADALEHFFFYYGYYQYMTDGDFWLNLEGTSEKYKQRAQFWAKCLKQTLSTYGWLPGVFGFWDDVRYRSWGYDKQYEIDRNWQTWYEEGKTQCWTNCTVDFCRYVSETYGPEDYSAFLE